jgi:hypothetical protein
MTSLDLWLCKSVRLAPLAALGSLRALTLRRATVTEYDPESLRALAGLTLLDFGDCYAVGLGPPHFEALADITGLRSLELDGVPISHTVRVGLALARLPSLSHLALPAGQPWPAGLTALTSLEIPPDWTGAIDATPSLRALRLGEGDVGPEPLTAAAAGLPGLVNLDLFGRHINGYRRHGAACMWFGAATDPTLAALSGLTALTALTELRLPRANLSCHEALRYRRCVDGLVSGLTRLRVMFEGPKDMFRFHGDDRTAEEAAAGTPGVRVCSCAKLPPRTHELIQKTEN